MTKPLVLAKQFEMKDGVKVKPLYIKNMSVDDWMLIRQIQQSLGGKTTATDAVRWAIRKAGGRF